MIRRFTSERIRKAHRRRLVRSFMLGALLIVSILFLAVEVVDLPEIRIDQVSFQGNRAITNEALMATVEPQLNGYYGYLFSRRNSFIFPRKAIESAVLDASVRVEDARVRLNGIGAVVVEVTERDPVGLWCGAISSARPCYFVDETGLAFAVASHRRMAGSGGSFVAYEKDLPIDPIGVHVTDEMHFRELMGAVEFMTTLGLTAHRIAWRADAIDAVVVDTRDTDLSTRVRLPLEGPYDMSLTNLASIIDDFDLSGVDYIDVRFENRVFYKEGTSANPDQGASGQPTANIEEEEDIE